MQINVFSDLLGLEEFFFDSVAEAKAGFERLKRDCQRRFRNDGIERTVFLITDSWNTVRRTEKGRHA